MLFFNRNDAYTKLSIMLLIRLQLAFQKLHPPPAYFYHIHSIVTHRITVNFRSYSQSKSQKQRQYIITVFDALRNTITTDMW